MHIMTGRVTKSDGSLSDFGNCTAMVCHSVRIRGQISSHTEKKGKDEMPYHVTSRLNLPCSLLCEEDPAHKILTDLKIEQLNNSNIDAVGSMQRACDLLQTETG